MAMPVNMILVMYVILCILSYDFNKLTMLYIHVHISLLFLLYLSLMTNKCGLTFFLSIKYLSVCIVLIFINIVQCLSQVILKYKTRLSIYFTHFYRIKLTYIVDSVYIIFIKM